MKKKHILSCLHQYSYFSWKGRNYKILICKPFNMIKQNDRIPDRQKMYHLIWKMTSLGTFYYYSQHFLIQLFSLMHSFASHGLVNQFSIAVQKYWMKNSRNTQFVSFIFYLFLRVIFYCLSYFSVPHPLPSQTSNNLGQVSNFILHVNTKSILLGFNIHWIFQEFNYHVLGRNVEYVFLDLYQELFNVYGKSPHWRQYQ